MPCDVSRVLAGCMLWRADCGVSPYVVDRRPPRLCLHSFSRLQTRHGHRRLLTRWRKALFIAAHVSCFSRSAMIRRSEKKWRFAYFLQKKELTMEKEKSWIQSFGVKCWRDLLAYGLNPPIRRWKLTRHLITLWNALSIAFKSFTRLQWYWSCPVCALSPQVFSVGLYTVTSWIFTYRNEEIIT